MKSSILKKTFAFIAFITVGLIVIIKFDASNNKTPVNIPKMVAENMSDPVGIQAHNGSNLDRDGINNLWDTTVPKDVEKIYFTQFFEIPTHKDEDVKNHNLIVIAGQIYTPHCDEEKTCRTRINMMFSETEKSDGKFSMPLQKFYEIKSGKIVKNCRILFNGTETPALECPANAHS